jgi:hypothetical protein
MKPYNLSFVIVTIAILITTLFNCPDFEVFEVFLRPDAR